MPYLDYAAIKSEISMADVLRLLNWSPIWRHGSQERGPCPVHGSRSRESRSFASNGMGWFCHGCKRGGDQLALYAEATRQPIYEATVDLCRQLGQAVYFLPGRVRPHAPEQ